MSGLLSLSSQVLRTIQNEWKLSVILMIAFIMRIWNLDFQSLWLDELHTMFESDPDQPWSYLWDYLTCCDQHPPLHYVITRLLFTLFGHTSYVARIFAVLAGTASVWAMFKLGKTIYHHRLGLIAATLTAVNFYNLRYSQEARGYILAFLFAALSFTYFIKLIQTPNKRHTLFYALTTIALLYTHYFSIFIIAAQGLLGLFFIFQETKEKRKKLWKFLLISAMMILIGYAPWLPSLIKAAQIKSFWIADLPDTFLNEYFSGYFGDSHLLIPLIVLLLVVFFVRVMVYHNNDGLQKIHNQPLQLAMLICITWTAVVYFIPYVRSVLVIPMLLPRYTIVALPAIILPIALGIDSFKNTIIRNLLLFVFVAISLTDILITKDFYYKIYKTQFREMMAFVSSENEENYPIINELTAAQNSYFIKKLKMENTVLSAKKEDLVDSILSQSSEKFVLDGFWIIRAHGDKALNEDKQKKLEKQYFRANSKTFFDAEATLFISKELENDDHIVIRYNEFAKNEGSLFENNMQIAIWGGAIHSQAVRLKEGRYEVNIFASGTSAKGLFPYLNIYFNDLLITSYYVTGEIRKKDFIFNNPADTTVIITVEMENDLSLPGGEDRNTFLEKIAMDRIPEKSR